MKQARLLLAGLMALNVLYFAWTQGWLAIFGTAPASLSEREPQRMAWQIRPAALQIRKESEPVATPPDAAASPLVPPTAATQGSPSAPGTPSTPHAEHEGL
ncbi:hypothetical protein WKW79_27735 [Variovorax robiniae]|uniref:Sporulation protein n=1 Tax=Variovorax robiniae TaxID=1836199 RepID=A0ABU8XEW2_9BURK